MVAILKVEGLGKSFKDKKVIEDIGFEVQKGEIMAILGPNGAGKSTSIRSILGIMYTEEGKILYEGKEVRHVPREKIGYLPEERGLYKSVKVIDLLLYFADLKDYPLHKAKTRALELLEKLGLEGKDKSSIEELSKGMAQKVQFIASIIHEPELLILDEPFSGLDPVSQDLFKKEIKALADQGTAILLSSHQMNIVEELCDRLFMINKGRKVIYGTLDDVKRKFANFKCTIQGVNEKNALEKIAHVVRVEQTGDRATLFLENDVDVNKWIRLIPSELDIQELKIDRISLHEIFIDIASDRLKGGYVYEK
ncbi:ABC transporter ATP-binding protein [Alkalihalobacillus pseudalcaliphilus]|uniref:ABC transporter ATP-binding protein n=1 Tax=Alkalihalobacillus pseudalcaliphilus TaxID=79884 RepID=UPI00064D9317|nr:ATP-binding cassette domain-containing protein [Alkalihalobacillus pseudalcaliphilus]KMK76109.1 ABC transporter ATP-binding protein [Alkalihalobacillus pseudalcaliphilus]